MFINPFYALTFFSKVDIVESIIAIGFLSLILGSFLYDWIPKIYSLYIRKRERKRWQSIESIIPKLKYPPPPSFDDSTYRIRGLTYNQWLDEFTIWSRGGYSERPRNVQGRIYAKEDSRWAFHFAAWKKETADAELEKLNAEFEKKSNLRQQLLREEYIRRYKKSPNEQDIPEHFCKICVHPPLHMYVIGEWHRKRRRHV